MSKGFRKIVPIIFEPRSLVWKVMGMAGMCYLGKNFFLVLIYSNPYIKMKKSEEEHPSKIKFHIIFLFFMMDI